MFHDRMLRIISVYKKDEVIQSCSLLLDEVFRKLKQIKEEAVSHFASKRRYKFNV